MDEQRTEVEQPAADEPATTAIVIEAGGPSAGQPSLARRLGAEFLGTLLLVAVGTGAATVLALGPAQRLRSLANLLPGAPAGQVQYLRALFQTSLGDLLPVAFAFATALAVLVYALGGVSGAHFNPAVTLALAVTRRLHWRDAPAYWVAQCLGGIAGAFVVAGIYGQIGASIEGTDILFGATTVQIGVDLWQAMLAEALVAFVWVFAIMAVAIDPRAPKGWSGLVIGLAVAGAILVTAAASGGSGDFARSLGPFVASIPYDVKSIPWSDLIVYAAGPVIGAVAAAFIYEAVVGLERVAPAPRPGSATSDAAPSGEDESSPAGTEGGATSSARSAPTES